MSWNNVINKQEKNSGNKAKHMCIACGCMVNAAPALGKVIWSSLPTFPNKYAIKTRKNTQSEQLL